MLETLKGKSGLGSTWRISCSNKECPTKATNAPFNKTAREKGFEINGASVLSFRAIGLGHSAAAKAFSFLGLKPIDDQYWTEHTKRIELEAKKALEKELDKATFEVKEFKFAAGEVDCSRDELPQTVVKAGVTINASWSSRGWSATDVVVAAISVNTGKVVDVVHLSSSCTECKKIEQKKQDGQMTHLQYLSVFMAHEENWYLNHEGSSAVSLHLVTFLSLLWFSFWKKDATKETS